MNCKYCNKQCKSSIAKSAHERFCKLNPNYQKNMQVHKQKCIKPASLASVKSKQQKSLIDPLNQIFTYQFICPKCGKHYTLNLKLRDYNKDNYIKFCSSHCSYSRVHTQQSKQKISNTLKKTLLQLTEHVCPKCGKHFEYAGSKNTNVLCDECKHKTSKQPKCKIRNKPSYIRPQICQLHKTNCPNCGKEIYTKHVGETYCYECTDILNLKQFKLYDKNGKQLCSERLRKKLSQSAKQLMAQGKIKPWQSRNIISYAEKFFRKVLSLNSITYIPELPVHGYFLDFVIKTPNGIIDLEIDGKQHWTDKTRIQHDKKRDVVLSSLGYIIYRIRWNTLNTNHGKIQMKQKIKNFLNFYKSLF